MQKEINHNHSLQHYLMRAQEKSSSGLNCHFLLYPQEQLLEKIIQINYFALLLVKTCIH